MKSGLVLMALCLAAVTPQGEGECPDGEGNWRHLNGRSYYQKKQPTPYTFSQAQQRCAALGATLANIKTPEIFGFVKNWLTETNTLGVWIGLTYSLSQNNANLLSSRRANWKWTDNDAETYDSLDAGYVWIDNHPQINQKCAIMAKISPSTVYKWYGRYCGTAKHNYICERANCASSSADDGPPCDAGWLQYENSCYLYLSSDTYSISSATQECIDTDDESYLVSITSSGESTFVKNLVPGNQEVWLGVKRAADPCGAVSGSNSVPSSCYTDSWTWVEGSTFDWEAWEKSSNIITATANLFADAEQYNEELCAVANRPSGFTDLKWFVATCSRGDVAHVVCERDARGSTGDTSAFSSGDHAMPMFSIASLTLATLMLHSLQHGIDI